MIRSYSELSRLTTFEERFGYLKLSGSVGSETFGYDRIFNQQFYNSTEWKNVRNFVIARDLGCDLGIAGYELERGLLIHHMNPITVGDISKKSDTLLNPEYLITTSLLSHNAIHYGNEKLISRKPIERTKNDTCPWKQ